MSFHALLIGALPYVDAAAPYAALGALVIGIFGSLSALSANRRIRRMTIKPGDNLADTLSELTRRVRELQAFREELELYLKQAETRLQRSVQGMSVVRFNPFQGDGSGGNQSFAAAFIDEHGTGTIFSALNTRTGQTSMYAKPLERGASSYELTPEEQEALQRAREHAKRDPRAEKQKVA